VPYAEPFDLPVQLSAETRRSPQQATARIDRQPSVSAGQASGIYRLSFPPQKQDGALALSVGDVRRWITLQPRQRPELAELGLKLRLPSYLGYKSEQRIDIRGGSVRVLKGAEAAFEARASRELASAERDGIPQRVEGARITADYRPIAEDLEWKFQWKDVEGLAPRDPLVLKVMAVDDEAPRIVARRETLEQVVLDSEVVTFDVTVSDDFGVKRVGLDWTGSRTQDDGKTPIAGEKISAAGEPEKREMAIRATFCATREGVAPQTLEMRAWAEDYLAGRKRSHSAAFVLHVLNKTGSRAVAHGAIRKVA
jgi:hypothetical protein